METPLQSALKKFLEAQRQNQLTLLDCTERVLALEAVLMALDHNAKDFLQQMRDKVRAENHMQREQIDSTFLALQALVSGFSNPPN